MFKAVIYETVVVDNVEYETRNEIEEVTIEECIVFLLKNKKSISRWKTLILMESCGSHYLIYWVFTNQEDRDNFIKLFPQLGEEDV